MKTKQDLLAQMTALRACTEATDWVTAQADDLTAHEIWLRCERIDWLIWLGGRLNPSAIAAFARRCADRAKKYAYADAYAARNADAYAAYAYAAYAYADAYAAAADPVAAYAAAYAAAAYAAAAADAAHAVERAAQRADLHATWDEIVGAA
jgi:hypothetical protein